MARSSRDEFHIDVDLDFARREAERIETLLRALRRRHDPARYEYTRVVRIVPGGDTFAHPVLTLGNRFAGSEDQLLSTYLHEQMHWYLRQLFTPDVDVIAPFMDDLVRRYPDAPITLPDGARNYEATYTHLVVNWLEVAALSEFVGRSRAMDLAREQKSYRWIYRTVLADWDALADLYERNGLVPIRSAQQLAEENLQMGGKVAKSSAAPKRKRAAAGKRSPPRSRSTLPARGGKSPG